MKFAESMINQLEKLKEFLLYRQKFSRVHAENSEIFIRNHDGNIILQIIKLNLVTKVFTSLKYWRCPLLLVQINTDQFVHLITDSKGLTVLLIHAMDLDDVKNIRSKSNKFIDVKCLFISGKYDTYSP
jgi:hypothetical protein